MGLQVKYYYVKRILEEASREVPLDLRSHKKNVFVWEDPWGLKLSGKQELTEAKKYINNKITNETYSRFDKKSEDDIIKQSIREVINKGSIDNVAKIIDHISEFKEPWISQFVSKYLYSTYKTVEEYPHVELIKGLNLGSNIWEFFKNDLFVEDLTDDLLSTLKFKCCLIAILYKNDLLDRQEVQGTLALVNTQQQVSAIIYFFNWDSKYGLFVGLVHQNFDDFATIINKFQEMYDTLPTKIQFTIDDLIEYNY
jgi:hypothetical protein